MISSFGPKPGVTQIIELPETHIDLIARLLRKCGTDDLMKETDRKTARAALAALSTQTDFAKEIGRHATYTGSPNKLIEQLIVTKGIRS
jgi:hypothetical protein